MPHFVIHCSPNVIQLQTPEDIMRTVHDTANATGLFKQGDIKVRIDPYQYYNVGNTKNDFIHVFAYIMEGRNTEQKSDLSRRITTVLTAMFPAVPVISINVSDFEKATYCNRTMI
ncbi:5-carboxymethyl-2-hydroxymuconate Delta-isomerase [Ferruginibacter sp.]